MPEPDRTNKLKYGEYLVTLAVSANITPDSQTGIGRWTEQDFLNRFYQYREYIEKGFARRRTGKFHPHALVEFRATHPVNMAETQGKRPRG